MDRVQITGTITHFRLESHNGYIARKMMVELDNGSKVWGSVSKGDLMVNDRIVFTARLNVQSENFAFFKYPILIDIIKE